METTETELQKIKEQAKEESKDGCVRHVNRTHNSYIISDWYDSDSTVTSYENGRQF